MLRIYFALGLSTYISAVYADLKYTKEEETSSLSQSQFFFYNLISLALVMFFWPLLWLIFYYSAASGVRVSDFKSFRIWRDSQNKKWKSLSELRDLSREFYSESENVQSGETIEGDAWND